MTWPALAARHKGVRQFEATCLGFLNQPAPAVRLDFEVQPCTFWRVVKICAPHLLSAVRRACRAALWRVLPNRPNAKAHGPNFTLANVGCADDGLD